MVNFANSVFKAYKEKMEAIAFSEALEEIGKLVSFLNRYLDEKAPWREGCKNIKEILNSTSHGIRIAAIMFAPFIPDASSKILDMMGLEDDLNKDGFKLLTQTMPSGTRIKKREILFPRKK